HLRFLFNDTATTEIYTLSLHDALPISRTRSPVHSTDCPRARQSPASWAQDRSEEHTSELQSHSDLVCRLLLVTNKPMKSALSALPRGVLPPAASTRAV